MNPRGLTRGDVFAELRTLLGIAKLRPDSDKDKTVLIIYLAGHIVKLSLLVCRRMILHTTADQSASSMCKVPSRIRCGRFRRLSQKCRSVRRLTRYGIAIGQEGGICWNIE